MLILSENTFISPTISLRAVSVRYYATCWECICSYQSSTLLSRTYIFWGKIDKQFYEIISECNECSKHYNMERRWSDKEGANYAGRMVHIVFC